MSRIRLGAGLLAGAAFALGVLGPASARTQTPSKYGGTLVVASTRGEPGALDPTRSGTFSAVEIYGTICEKLYDHDGRGQIVPQLAAALPVVSKDKRTYTIPLRRGVLFNDGTPFNAQAVVTTIERYKTHETSGRSSDLEPIDSVTAAGQYAVVLHLKTPFAPLLDNLAVPAGTVLSPTQLAKTGDEFGNDPICVGPFMFDHRLAGDSVTVIKSPHYYDRNRVFLDKIVFRFLADAPAVAALKAGDVQAVDSISPTELPGVAQSSRLRIAEQKTFGFVFLGFNIGNKSGLGNLPYSNVGTVWSTKPKLRQAFEEAIDRKALARVVFGGGAQPGCASIAPISPWFDPSIKCTPYAPAHARKLVAASGVQSPTLRLMVGSDADLQRLAQFIQAQEAAVGINVVIEPLFGSRVLRGDFEAHIGIHTAGSNEPDRKLNQFLATSGDNNRGGYSNPRLDLILANGRKAMTEKARRTLYGVAQQIILADRPFIYLYHPITFAGINTTRVTGVDLFPDTTLRVAFAPLI